MSWYEDPDEGCDCIGFCHHVAQKTPAAPQGLRGLLDDAEAEREALREQLRALAGSVASGDWRSAKDLAARALAELDRGPK